MTCSVEASVDRGGAERQHSKEDNLPPRSHTVRASIALAAALALTGCTTLGGDAMSRRAEIAWQSMHALDTLQTMHIANSGGCYREVNPVTSRIIGEHPSDAGVSAVMLGYAMLHKFATDQLNERGAPRWMIGTWHAVTLGFAVKTVTQNHQLGLRPLGRGC